VSGPGVPGGARPPSGPGVPGGARPPSAKVALVTLGCGRNDADSAQVGGALESAGFALVDDPVDADCVLVNTCTFIAPARQESVDEILAACDLPGRVLVIGCMAQRYGDELAEALPEVAGVLSFADYPRIAQIVAAAVGAPAATPAVPDAERALLPLAPAPSAPARVVAAAPPTAAFPVRTAPRGPWAYLKIAGGCDRVCTFCTIPSYRGRFASRPLDEVLAEARWLAQQGARELVCVSENTTSWGKDLPGGRRAQADLIRGFGRVEGLERVRLLYLQPAEIVPELLDAMAASPVVAGYYDLSLQHAAPDVVARMGRSGGAERFLALIEDIRRRDPDAVFRSSFIVGFPGETAADVALLEEFLVAARLDWAGFFPFSVEDGTPSATMPEQVPADEAAARREHLVSVAESVAEAQAERFVGRVLDVLVEDDDDGAALARSYREAPETDGEVRLPGVALPVGAFTRVRVTATDGVDLVGEFAS
jgi:ribosomal protein S12 methylthiotransferase